MRTARQVVSDFEILYKLYEKNLYTNSAPQQHVTIYDEPQRENVERALCPSTNSKRSYSVYLYSNNKNVYLSMYGII